MNRFPALRFAVAAGIFLSLHAVVVTFCCYGRYPRDASICGVTHAILRTVRIFNFGNGNYGRRPIRIFRRVRALRHLRPDLQMVADIAVINSVPLNWERVAMSALGH